MVQYESEFHVVVLEEPKTLYRGCFDAEDPIEDLRSNYERGRGGNPVDLYVTALHMAVSMFEDRDLVARLCRRSPDRLGEFVAQIDLQPEFGVCIADTRGPGHWSIWGRPTQLREFVTDVSRA